MIINKLKYLHINHLCVGKCSDLIVSMLASRLSGLGSSPGQGHCVIFLDETLCSHGASFHHMATSIEFNAGGNPAVY